MAQCTAKSKRSGNQCRREALPGKKVCYHHGGASLSGLAHPNFKTGRYITALPDRLAARFLESRSDDELLNMRSDIALVDARIDDLLGTTRISPYVDLIEKLQETVTGLKHAVDSGDTVTLLSSIDIIDDTIKEGKQDVMTWQQILSMLEMRRKLVESEQKRLVAMNQMVTAEQAMNLIARLLAAVKDHVDDKATLNAIAGEFAAIAGPVDNNVLDRRPG